MSHRIVIKTEIKNRKIAEAALNTQGWSYSIEGNTISIHDGPLANARVDLITGTVQGDTDFHSKRDLGALSQPYGEAEWMDRIASQNGYVQERQVLSDGTIRLTAEVQLA